MLNSLRNLIASMLDLLQGGDVHRSRRNLERLKRTRDDLLTLAAMPGPPEMLQVIREHLRSSQSMVSFVESQIVVQEAAIAEARKVKRHGHLSDDEISQCMIRAEVERHGTPLGGPGRDDEVEKTEPSSVDRSRAN